MTNNFWQCDHLKQFRQSKDSVTSAKYLEGIPECQNQSSVHNGNIFFECIKKKTKSPAFPLMSSEYIFSAQQ